MMEYIKAICQTLYHITSRQYAKLYITRTLDRQLYGKALKIWVVLRSITLEAQSYLLPMIMSVPAVETLIEQHYIFCSLSHSGLAGSDI